jgi:hypothetical protein
MKINGNSKDWGTLSKTRIVRENIKFSTELSLFKIEKELKLKKKQTRIESIIKYNSRYYNIFTIFIQFIYKFTIYKISIFIELKLL